MKLSVSLPVVLFIALCAGACGAGATESPGSGADPTGLAATIDSGVALTLAARDAESTRAPEVQPTATEVPATATSEPLSAGN